MIRTRSEPSDQNCSNPVCRLARTSLMIPGQRPHAPDAEHILAEANAPHAEHILEEKSTPHAEHTLWQGCNAVRTPCGAHPLADTNAPQAEQRDALV